MGSYGGYYKGEQKKKRKEILEKKVKQITHIYIPPKIDIIRKKGK